MSVNNDDFWLNAWKDLDVDKMTRLEAIRALKWMTLYIEDLRHSRDHLLDTIRIRFEREKR